MIILTLRLIGLSAGEEKWLARFYALTVIVLAFLTTIFYVRISYAQKVTPSVGRDLSAEWQGLGWGGAAVRQAV